MEVEGTADVSMNTGELLLASTELHENLRRIVSYGCSINVLESQAVGSQRLLRYGMSGPQISTLETEGWSNPEPIEFIQDRLVAEMTRRIGTQPESVDISFLSQRLKTDVPKEDIAKDRKERVNPYLVDEQDLLKSVREATRQITGREKLYNMDEVDRSFQFDAVSLRNREVPIVDEKVLVPSWGQYVRVALNAKDVTSPKTARFDTFRSYPKVPPNFIYAKPVEAAVDVKDLSTMDGSQLDKKSSIDTVDGESPSDMEDTRVSLSSRPPGNVVEQTIKWSTSSDVFFTPLSVEKAQPPRRTILSPRDFQESDYLGDLPGDPHTSTARSTNKEVTGAVHSRKPVDETKRKMLEQERLLKALRASGEDRI
jgi:hypothetical protein